jgi:hypothetical protein
MSSFFVPTPTDAVSESDILLSATGENNESTIFAKEIPAELICPIHFGVLDNPAECANGHLFCEGCISKWWQTKGTQSCPVCKVEGDFESSLSVRALVNNLDIVCPNGRASHDSSGCVWRGKYMSLKSHVASCMFEEVKCRNTPCHVTMMRQRAASHETEECEYRKVACKYCSQKCVVNQLEAHYGGSCAEYEVHCLCGLALKRGQLGQHVANVCPDAVVTCPFKVHGCKKGHMYRREYSAHQTAEAAYHSELLAEKLSLVVVQQQEYSQVNEEKIKQVEKRLINYVNSAEQSMVSIETSLLEKIKALEATVAHLSGQLHCSK